MRLLAALACAVSLAGCRQLFGIDDIAQQVDASIEEPDASSLDAATCGWKAPNISDTCAHQSSVDVRIPTKATFRANQAAAVGVFDLGGGMLIDVPCRNETSGTRTYRVCAMASLEVSAALALQSSTPLIFVVHGDATFSDASVVNADDCGPVLSELGAIANCEGKPSTPMVGGGGGAGGTGYTKGGAGGNGQGASSGGGQAVDVTMPASLEPLVAGGAGCAARGSFNRLGGRSGGAFELTAKGRVTISGRFESVGRGGLAPGTNTMIMMGGSGGGSGGAILIDGDQVIIQSSASFLLAGGGGGASAFGFAGSPSGSAMPTVGYDITRPMAGGVAPSQGGSGGNGAGPNVAMALPGGNGSATAPTIGGGGGGGGGGGRLRLSGRSRLIKPADVKIVPASAAEP